MKVQALLLLLGAVLAAATSVAHVGLPQVSDDADCQGNPQTDRWRKDCNWCSCRNGRGTCTRRLCIEGKEDPGPQCEGNPTWKDDCNTCTCANGRAVCTSMHCDQPGPQSAEVQIASAVCEEGSRWRVACNWCTCDNGRSHCTESACGDWNEDKALEEGIVECHGESRWKKDCNWCNCVNGRGVCTKIACIPSERNPFHNLPANAVCVPGSRWLEECNWCTCGDNGIAACTLKACIPGYVHDGSTCTNGSVWRKDCNICRCIDGASACSKRLCPTSSQAPQVAQMPQVAQVPQVAEKSQCQGDAGTDRWRMDCNWCSCRNGVGACTRRLCPEGMKEEGPECEGNPSWIKDCRHCTCVNGTAVCTAKFCGPLPARPAIHMTPKKPECESEAETDYWTKDCNRCMCRNGVAACTKRLCRGGEENLPICEGNPSWKKDCNHCRCNNGTAVCTTKYCGNPLGPQNRRVQVTIVKKNKNPVCEDGSRWRVGCNWCSCHGGMAVCTLKACVDQSAESDEPECVGDATWKRDCNWCTCGDGLALCTRMACLTETEEPCTEGTSWWDGCNTCRCTQGFTVCTKRACPKRDGQKECQGDSCGSNQLSELCHLPPVEGNIQCTAFIRKWSFSMSDEVCKQIVYGGCGGTGNLFDSEEECKAACPSTSTTNQITHTFGISRTVSQEIGRCHLPIVSGPCFGAFPRYAYNSANGRCEEFLYGGCAGNANNFDTEEKCTSACQGSQEATCDKSKCPWHLWDHYLAKGCSPQYTGDACCPTSFQCSSASESGKDLTKCYYRGVTYSIGDSVPVEEPCSASCRCVESHDPSGPAEINCASIECPELFRPPPPGCRPLYRTGKCCAYDHECVDPNAPPLEPRAVTCSWQNKTYYDGSEMYFDDYPCQSCICGPGFTDPTGPGCSKIDCGLEFRYTSEYYRGCTPIHFEHNRCCPISWMCPDDSRIEPQQQQQQQQQQQSASSDESSMCHLGERRFAVGEALDLTDCKLECRCLTPPELTCIQYRTCEVAQENAVQRACPPMQCDTGCHPVVDSPGQCPTCSCSQDIFSCPAQTCPSNCSSDVDLETGCPTCKCQCTNELVCPNGCPSHTVLDEATGCPRCECKPGSPQVRSPEACPVYPGGEVPCPQDCAIIKTVDENGCEVCTCDPNDTENPFGPPLPPKIQVQDTVCPIYPGGRAPCPMDCAIIRRTDENGCEVCECDPTNPENPFGPPLPPQLRVRRSSCPGQWEAPCPMDCAIIRYTDENGCGVCKCDPNNPGNPFIHPLPPVLIAHDTACPNGPAPCPMDCAVIRDTDENGCEVCKCDPNNPGNPFGPPLTSIPTFCPQKGQAPCPMDCAVIRRVDENGCEVCECDPDNPGNPFGRPLPAQLRVRRSSCPGQWEAPCPMDCAVIRYADENGCWVCKCDPSNPGNPFSPYTPYW